MYPYFTPFSFTDVKTAKNLELLLNQQSNNASHTLVNMMDSCSTHGGSRLLRASLLHPPCSQPFITKRQDSVQELVENPEIAQKIRVCLCVVTLIPANLFTYAITFYFRRFFSSYLILNSF